MADTADWPLTHPPGFLWTRTRSEEKALSDWTEVKRRTYLADCERLVERGWLDRKLIHGYVTFWLSENGVKALELDAALNEAMEATN